MNDQTLLKKLATSQDLNGVRQEVTGLKSDVAGLKTDVAGLKTDVTELKTDVAGLREGVTNLRVAIPNLETKMEAKLSDGKIEILRWMLTLFVVTMLAIFGLYFK